MGKIILVKSPIPNRGWGMKLSDIIQVSSIIVYVIVTLVTAQKMDKALLLEIGLLLIFLISFWYSLYSRYKDIKKEQSETFGTNKRDLKEQIDSEREERVVTDQKLLDKLAAIDQQLSDRLNKIESKLGLV